MRPDHSHHPHRASTLLASLALALASGCVNQRSERGVEALWHDAGPESFEPGRTTRSQVMEILGPPSQILSLAAGSAFYYMLETTHTRGLILLLYNQRSEETSYDRAVFFFDQQDVLTDYALSAAPR